MKIEVDILGVEQAVDFETMAAAQFVVLDVLGARLRVPITEEQMETLTRAAVGKKVAPVVHEAVVAWDETREQSAESPQDHVSEEVPEREHSMSSPAYTGMMAELADASPAAEEAPSGILEGFFDESEEEKARKLRERKPQRRTVPRDEAGNPVVEQRASLPAVPGFSALSDDDGFAQG